MVATVVLGVMLLAWSGSFTYLATQRFWSMHPRR